MIVNDVEFDEEGKIVDIISKKTLVDTPEERVRQRFIKILISDYGYPIKLIKREIPIQSGSKILLDDNGNEIRADIVIYNNEKSALKQDQGNILFVVECKQEKVTEGYNQLVSYIYNTSAIGGVWTNGDSINVYRKQKTINLGLEPLVSLPRYKENWLDDSDKILPKSELKHPHNVRFLLQSCHNKLYGRGMENEDFDLAMDMVRILLAKIQDETSPGEYPKFWITNKDFQTAEGRTKVAKTVHELFRKYADQYPDIFEKHEKIQVGDDCIAEAVGVLQKWGLAAKNDDADEWDLMGETYEQFTHINLKRQRGQFFTNRLVVNMMVSILDPEIGEHALDPAGGSGGFATAIFRYLRRKIVKNTAPNTAIRDRQINTIKDSVYLVEIASRLVKIAKCAMLLTGDGQSGMTCGNSLDDNTHLDPWIQARCSIDSSNSPSIIATNPPFSGQKIESQQSDPTILKLYDFGHSFVRGENNTFKFYDDDFHILQRQAPELLFLEKCVKWVKPNGRIGIVLPKGFLDNISYEAYRWWLMQKCEITGVVTLHKDTFQPDTGVRTCVLFLRKKVVGEKDRDYNIFMAQSQRIGQDSKGNKVYTIDNNGNATDELNQDLDEIAKLYHEFTQNGSIHNSEYVFSIKASDIRDNININPQHYSPKLNRAIDNVLKYDEKDNWSVTTVGQLEAGMRIFMGPRWNSASIKVDNKEEVKKPTAYLTANGALELRRFTIKWMDLSKATPKQIQCASMLRVHEGDILISRSGTIGKVTYATKDLAKNYLVSDDLIRIRVQDRNLRAYLLAFFTSQTALKLMLLDEYGSVQQHLQPRHIQNMIIPIPEDWELARKLIDVGEDMIDAMESLSIADKKCREKGFDSFCING